MKHIEMAPMPNEIKCIFFSEFHPTAGPKIEYQVPEDFISREDFDTLHVYIITKPELVNKTITINALGHKIVGCPIIINDAKYARNALIFNLCFVFDNTSNTICYENTVKKLAGYLTKLETESGFLTRQEGRDSIPKHLATIKDKLNDTGACCIKIDQSTTIHLKVILESNDPPSVQDHDVPIVDPAFLSHANGCMDLAAEQLLSYIDGFKHVARIAAESDVDISIVKACIQNLVYHGALKLIPIFQYSNVYMTTPALSQLTENMDLQQQCLTYVAKPGKCAVLREVLMLYCSLTAGTTVRDMCARWNPHSMGIDERKLIQFGLMRSLIRRLQKFPVKLPNEPGNNNKHRRLYSWFNGRHGYDEICCKTGLSYMELDEKVENDPSIVVCWK